MGVATVRSLPMGQAEPQELPLIAECHLDDAALEEQRDRYAALGRELLELERRERRLEARFSPRVDEGLLRETMEVERECCPFFRLSYDSSRRSLSITVDDPAQDPALDALRYSLTQAE
jgi:hypothetical protein